MPTPLLVIIAHLNVSPAIKLPLTVSPVTQIDITLIQLLALCVQILVYNAHLPQLVPRASMDHTSSEIHHAL
jgi:hypothetical protein